MTKHSFQTFREKLTGIQLGPGYHFLPLIVTPCYRLCETMKMILYTSELGSVDLRPLKQVFRYFLSSFSLINFAMKTRVASTKLLRMSKK
jgi:hypothetical protein